MSNWPTDSTDELPSANGILQCLRMLADEAAGLQLAGTLNALRTAIAVCAAESDPISAGIDAPDGTRLH